MFTFVNMVPKQDLSKHDFKTGKPKPKIDQQTEDLLNSIRAVQASLEGFGNSFHNIGEVTRRIPTPKTRTEKFFELPTLLKVSCTSLFVMFILPTLAMLFLFVAGMFSTKTVNPEGVTYYEIYMNVLSVIRIIGICISGLSLSIYTLWKSK